MRAGWAIALSMALTACATSSVTLLPNEGDQSTGSVAVLGKPGQEVVLDKPMTAGNLSGGPARVRPVSEVKPAYQQLLTTLPPPPSRYVLNFVQGTTQITEASRPTLDTIRNEVAARPGAVVDVVGHTDTVGSEQDNDVLSRQRAAEVVRALVAEGFSPDLLSAVGRGERELLVKTGDNVASDANRRVEVVVR